jgi:hypothetical protein
MTDPHNKSEIQPVGRTMTSQLADDLSELLEQRVREENQKPDTNPGEPQAEPPEQTDGSKA